MRARGGGEVGFARCLGRGVVMIAICWGFKGGAYRAACFAGVLRDVDSYGFYDFKRVQVSPSEYKVNPSESK